MLFNWLHNAVRGEIVLHSEHNKHELVLAEFIEAIIHVFNGDWDLHVEVLGVVQRIRIDQLLLQVGSQVDKLGPIVESQVVKTVDLTYFVSKWSELLQL